MAVGPFRPPTRMVVRSSATEEDCSGTEELLSVPLVQAVKDSAITADIASASRRFIGKLLLCRLFEYIFHGIYP